MKSKVLVVDDKAMMRDSVSTTLQRAGFIPVAASDGPTALSLLGKHQPQAVITDLKMPEMDGLELLMRLKQVDHRLPVILMTAFGDVDAAVNAMKRGAFDFIQKPFDGDAMVRTVRKAISARAAADAGDDGAAAAGAATGRKHCLVGQSGAMRRLAQQIQQIARSHGSVLIRGESGSGKEVVARTLHAHSPRRDKPMLCLNCAALSSSLLESELFGHEKGAFTGADQLRKGRFELADGGTLLLDEISEIEPPLQAKLLRVLQESQFERVGSSTTMSVDVRVIATTNRDLEQCVAEGAFRQDLFYRINVLPLHLPPLRDRRDDLPLLAQHFLAQLAERDEATPKRFDDEAMSLLQGYDWPGNVRELQNICERAHVLSRSGVIAGSLIRPWLTWSRPIGAEAELLAEPPASSGMAVDPVGGVEVKRLEDVEREQIIAALGRFEGNRQRTAAALGIGVRTLGLKLKKWKQQNLVAQSL